MEGILLQEEPDLIRFRDIYGITYTLKKEILNIPEMLDANPIKTATPTRIFTEESHATTTIERSKKRTLAEIGRDNLRKRTGKARVLTNARPKVVLPSWPKTEPELQEWIAENEQELQRLAGKCRAAGGSPSAKHTYREDTYTVEGKTVVVGGYWADPEEVESARQICSDALLLEKALGLARKDLEQMQPQPAMLR